MHSTNTLTGQDQVNAQVNGPNGLKLKLRGHSIIPTLISPQIGFAISPSTEVMIRFLPRQRYAGKFKGSVLGLGVKHTLTEDIFGPNDHIYPVPPPVDIAAYAGFTTESVFYKLTFLPSLYDKVSSGNTATNYSGQQVRMRSNDLTAGLILSKKFSIFSPHLGIAWSATSTQIAVLGIYPVNATVSPGYTTLLNIHDPFLVKDSHGRLNTDLGLTLNLAFFRINSDFILSRYNRIHIGISLFF